MTQHDNWYTEGNKSFKKGRFEEALKYYDKVIEIDLNNAKALTSKGIALNYLGKYNEAIECADKAIKKKMIMLMH